MLFDFLKKNKKESQSTVEPEYPSVLPKITLVQGKEEIPELQGDYAKTIFLWANSKSALVRKDDEYTRYMLYECGIKHPSEYHERLIREGYLEKDSAEKAFMSLKVPDLKELATQLGTAKSGKKADLVSRILSTADSNFLAAHQPVTYSLSEKGATFLNEHDAYVQLHRHSVWGIDWKEYDAAHISGESFYETAIRVLKSHAAQDNRLFGRQEYLNLSQIYEEIGDKQKALAYVLQMFYIDLSGVSELDSISYCKEGAFTKKQLLEWYEGSNPITPWVVSKLAEHAEFYSDSIVDKLYTWQLPFQICSKTLFLKIVHSAIDGKLDNEKAFDELKSSYKRFLARL